MFLNNINFICVIYLKPNILYTYLFLLDTSCVMYINKDNLRKDLSILFLRDVTVVFINSYVLLYCKH